MNSCLPETTEAEPIMAPSDGVPITTSSFDHVRLTVTDIDRSRAFYDAVFGWPIAWEMPADPDEATRIWTRPRRTSTNWVSRTKA